MEEMLREYRRHDMLKLTFDGRSRIFFEMASSGLDLPMRVLSDIMLKRGPRDHIPAIVRRGAYMDHGAINIGFPFYERVNGNKVRLASSVRRDEICDIISPYAVPFCDFEATTRCLELLRRAASMPSFKVGRIGVVGSAAFEVITGSRYTDDDSDLDIVIRDCSFDEINEIYTGITQLSQEMSVKADMEVQLKNGYGVKAQELFIGSTTLMGKSLYDVKLFGRQEVMDLLRPNA